MTNAEKIEKIKTAQALLNKLSAQMDIVNGSLEQRIENTKLKFELQNSSIALSSVIVELCLNDLPLGFMKDIVEIELNEDKQIDNY